MTLGESDISHGLLQLVIDNRGAEFHTRFNSTCYSYPGTPQMSALAGLSAA